MPHHNPSPLYETGPGIEPATFGLADECSTTELTLLLAPGYLGHSSKVSNTSGKFITLRLDIKKMKKYTHMKLLHTNDLRDEMYEDVKKCKVFFCAFFNSLIHQTYTK